MVFPKLRLQFFVEIIERNCNSNFVVAIIWKGKFGMTIRVKLVHHLIFTLSATVLPCCLSSSNGIKCWYTQMVYPCHIYHMAHPKIQYPCGDTDLFHSFCKVNLLQNLPVKKGKNRINENYFLEFGPFLIEHEAEKIKNKFCRWCCLLDCMTLYDNSFTDLSDNTIKST